MNKISVFSKHFPKKKNLIILFFSFVFFFVLVFSRKVCLAQVPGESLVVNGDTVEYLTEKNEIVAKGNVSVNYQGTILTCEKLTVNTQTKQAIAEGNVTIRDVHGLMYGERILYNFKTKQGTIENAKFYSQPYFGKAEKIELVSDKQFDVYNGRLSTCNFNQPHYHLKSRKLSFYSQDKIKSWENVLYFGALPVAYVPYYRHSLKDNATHIQLTPGYSDQWGAYLLTATRYYLSESVQGKIYFDYRNKLGFAEGISANYKNTGFGSGDFKFYYTTERPKEGLPKESGDFQRYFARLRHHWQIDEQTYFTGEVHRIVDDKRRKFGSVYNILKDYFPRNYERDPKPISYALLNHNFTHSQLSFYLEKRINRWYDQIEKLPEITYSLPSLPIFSTPFYFEDTTKATVFNKKEASPSPSWKDESVNRLDTLNKISLPTNFSIFEFTPYVAERFTYYSKDNSGDSIGVRSVFYSGIDVSTKFYRIYDLTSNFLNIEINRLRHIISPTIGYAYNNQPSIPSTKLYQMDAIDAIGHSNAFTLGVSNKLQTKRNNETIDFVDFKVDSIYYLYRRIPTSGITVHDELSDIILKLKVFPYNWLQFYSDANYVAEKRQFSTINYDFMFNFGNEKQIGLGQRYQYDGSNEITVSSEWRLTPKWKFHLYERIQTADKADLRKGFVVQEYGFTRDLHCWLWELTYSHEKTKGDAIWCVFKLKAFPEIGVDFRQGFNSPQSGPQTK
ncbi:MAG: hypothetical protein N2606_03175 [Candidatus Omnitrophica bacterium]|nr:hypothetical protein [Candidatus Omnitrophota bacterium]